MVGVKFIFPLNQRECILICPTERESVKAIHVYGLADSRVLKLLSSEEQSNGYQAVCALAAN